MKSISKNPFLILNLALRALANNPVILYPVFVLGCIQLFILEIIYFAPRYPLSRIFAPMIRKAYGSEYLHYPYNFLLLSKCYHGALIYIFISGIFYAALIWIIVLVNEGVPIDLKNVFKRVFHSYLHLALAMTLSVIVFKGASFLYALVVKLTGLKILILLFPYMQLLFSSCAFSLFVFVLPIIIIEQKSMSEAVKLNFSKFNGLLGLFFWVSLLCSLLYLPFLLFRIYLSDQLTPMAPEKSGLLFVISILVIIFIDAIRYTTITLCYLSRKEEQS